MLHLHFRTFPVLLGFILLTFAACGGQEATGRAAGTAQSTTGASGAGGAAGATSTLASGTGGAVGTGGPGGAAGGPLINPGDAGLSCDPQRAVSKIDLLFMIDNSSSMADKQAILATAVPDLVSRLIDPICVDPVTLRPVGMRSADGTCAMGIPEFPPVKDIHIGIISSSLGGHGTTGVCDDPDPRRTFPHHQDFGRLIHRDAMDGNVATFRNLGFLNWNPTPNSGGAATAAQIVMPFTTMVTGVGQHGCGYEASLEATYRFLMDPNPYATITTSGTPPVATLAGTDTALLQQRADFLRPDSLLAVLALTDENDCSIIDGGQGFYPIVPSAGTPRQGLLGHGTTACLSNPNDACCFNCGQAPPPGCNAPANDPECLKGPWLQTEDQENIRCWDQKRRYGVDFLYPVERYINGFVGSMVADRDNKVVKNPIYDDLSPGCRTGMVCATERNKGLVFFSGIVGVPWQDIAVDPSDLTQGYLSAKQINDNGVWAKILGNPKASPPVRPTDLHMVESIAPRMGLADINSAANADPIHGHEWDTAKATPPNSDLQYACAFPLPAPKACTDTTDCDCFVPPPGAIADTKNPLCQGAAGYSTTQVRAKAYPGTRVLQVLQGLGDQGIAASICPAQSTNVDAADYGYRPAIAAIIARLRFLLAGCNIPK